MLVILENVPQTADDWSRFSFHHQDSHDRIRAAISAKKSIVLPEHLIYPINQAAVPLFLQNNYLLHLDMNSALGLQGSDLLEVNIQDKKELAIWVQLHYQEHFQAELALGL